MAILLANFLPCLHISAVIGRFLATYGTATLARDIHRGQVEVVKHLPRVREGRDYVWLAPYTTRQATYFGLQVLAKLPLFRGQFHAGLTKLLHFGKRVSQTGGQPFIVSVVRILHEAIIFTPTDNPTLRVDSSEMRAYGAPYQQETAGWIGPVDGADDEPRRGCDEDDRDAR